MYVSIRIYLCICVCVCIYIYIYTHTKLEGKIISKGKKIEREIGIARKIEKLLIIDSQNSEQCVQSMCKSRVDSTEIQKFTKDPPYLATTPSKVYPNKHLYNVDMKVYYRFIDR